VSRYPIDAARYKRQQKARALQAVESGYWPVRVVLARIPDALGNTDIWAVLMHAPTLGSKGAREVLERAAVFPHTKLGQLTRRERGDILRALPRESSKENQPVATLGEIYALRALETDNEAGTPQYTPGQHFARMVSVDTASLSFVDRGRHVCIIPVHKHEDGQWYHLGSSIRVGRTLLQLSGPLRKQATTSVTRCSRRSVKRRRAMRRRSGRKLLHNDRLQQVS
jgi:hypothetical protein